MSWASGPSASVSASASAPDANSVAAAVASKRSSGAVQPRRRASAKTPATLIQRPAAVAERQARRAERPIERDLERHIDRDPDQRDLHRRRGVAAREKARGRDAIDEQRGHAESVGREHACGLMRRVGLEGAMLEGDGDDEIGDEKKNHHEGSAERQRQRGGAVLRGERSPFIAAGDEGGHLPQAAPSRWR